MTLPRCIEARTRVDFVLWPHRFDRDRSPSRLARYAGLPLWAALVKTRITLDRVTRFKWTTAFERRAREQRINHGKGVARKTKTGPANAPLSAANQLALKGRSMWKSRTRYFTASATTEREQLFEVIHIYLN